MANGGAAADCLVVGGGLIGLLSAWELRRAGATVVLAERGHAGREASWAGGGILSPLYPWRYPDAVTALARWSQGAYPDLAREIAARGGVDPEWTASGLLILDTDEAAAARDWAARWGYACETPAGAALAACEPALRGAGQALWFPEIAQIRNPRLTRGLRAAATAAGVEILEDCEVRRILLDGERAVGAQTADGSLAAGCVLVAAGPWSAALVEGFGVPLPVTPVRGQMILLRAAPGTLSRIVLQRARYVIPRRDGHVLVGSTLEEVGFDKSTTDEARRELHEFAVGLFPQLADATIERQWAGLRPSAPAGIPYIGEHTKISGLFLNTGHYRNGVVLAPASAKLVADLILDEPPIMDSTPYTLTAVRDDGTPDQDPPPAN